MPLSFFLGVVITISRLYAEREIYGYISGGLSQNSIIRYLNSRSIKFKHLEYSDHHHYSNNDINNILKLSRNSLVLTTKKDYYKLKDNINNLLYLDIETRFLKNEDQFLKEVYKILN